MPIFTSFSPSEVPDWMTSLAKAFDEFDPFEEPVYPCEHDKYRCTVSSCDNYQCTHNEMPGDCTVKTCVNSMKVMYGDE